MRKLQNPIHIKTLCRVVCCMILLITAVHLTPYAQVPDRIDYGIKQYTRFYRADKLIRKKFAQYDTLEMINKDAGITQLRSIIDIGKEENIPRAVFVAAERMSIDYVEKGEYRRAVDVCLQAAPSFTAKENRPYLDLMYSQIGAGYWGMGYYDSSLIYYYKGLAALEGVERVSPSDSSTLYSRIATIWDQLGEPGHAIAIYKHALKIAERKGNTETICNTVVAIAVSYYEIDSLALAKFYLDKAIELAAGDDFFLIVPTFTLGQIADVRKQYPKALEYMYRARQHVKLSKQNALQDAMIRAGIGKIYLHMHEYDKAGKIIMIAYKDVESMHNFYALQDMQYDMSTIKSASGAYKDAYGYMELYVRTADSLRKEQAGRAKDIWLNAMMEDKNKAVLAQQLDIARHKSQLQQKNIWMGGVGLGTLLIVIICIATVRSYRHKQVIQLSQLEQLQQADEISQLKGQMLGTQQERRRTAQELHYGVAQQLMAITRQVADMQSVDSLQLRKENIAAVFQQLSTVASHVRKTAHSLMPDMLMTQGLAAALASMCRGMSSDKGLEIAFQEYGTAQEVDKEIELAIYRLVQELVTDAVARATPDTALLVQLSYVDGYMNITIEDNNATPVMPAVNGHANRLAQIKNRVAALKGSFDVQSAPGKGNTAYLEFDLQYF